MKIRFVPNREHLRRMREIGPNLRMALSMDDPALLRALGTVHVAQERRIFASEGAEGGGGPFAPLNPRYAERKRKVAPRKKILQLTGGTRDRFTKKQNPGYVEQFIPTSETHGLFRFGARSDVAAAHFRGNPALAPRPSGLAARIFGGRAQRLPVRDMITKTAAHLEEMRERLRTWYIARLQASIRARGRLT